MVPAVVAPVAFHVSSKAVRAVHQFVTVKSEVETVPCVALFLSAVAVAQQCAAPVAVGLEPEHQRVVVVAGAVQCHVGHFHSVVLFL